ncbi:MAG: (d)CMP kinase [Rickettsiales bacterium]|nr:(d)CMP kinase [Rickettsiales bacterium]
MIIAIDGPAGSGKGTIARMLAEKFNLEYLDTGKLYRAVALQSLISLGYSEIDNSLQVSPEILKDEAVKISKNLDSSFIKSPIIETEIVGNFASIVSENLEVRRNLIDFQRRIANSPKGAVLDGRDIGTIICPNADYKFFITASLETRAKRRFEQLKSNPNITYNQVYDDIKRRDERDKARVSAPLKQAKDAETIDTSELSIQDVFNKISNQISSKN